MSSVREAYTTVVEGLKSNNIENWAQEAKLLISWALCENPSIIFTRPDEKISSNALEKLNTAVSKRIKHYPLQYIIGSTEFMSLEFEVNEDVLIPRADTEVLVERVLEHLNGQSQSCKVLDLCTGSGCIIISIAKYAEGEFHASDLSERALKVAGRNALANGAQINWHQGDLFSAIESGLQFDMIVSNPPYIDAVDMSRLQPEVQHEPSMALVGGADGLDFYRRIAHLAKEYLVDGGRLIMEHGIHQEESINKILCSEGYHSISYIKDYSGINRVIEGRYYSTH